MARDPILLIDKHGLGFELIPEDQRRIIFIDHTGVTTVALLDQDTIGTVKNIINKIEEAMNG